MPYEILKRDKIYCVYKKGGEAVKCYSTLAQATKLLRALYANVEDADERVDRAIAEAYMRITADKMMPSLDKWSERHFERAYQYLERIVVESQPMDDIRAFRAAQPVQCVRVDLNEVENPSQVWVLAMPYNVVDSFNSYFGPETDIRGDLTVEQVPVFDTHGLGGGSIDVQPLGYVVRWEERDTGRWALVQLNESDPRAQDFMRAAAECKLTASVGMLRAAMYPQPPLDTGGIYPEPTLLQQAPVVELSLIIETEDGFRASNPQAIAGYNFSETSLRGEQMCQDCQNSADELRAQIEALRAEMEKLKHERDEAAKHAEEMRKRMSAERASQRMMQWKVPQDIIDEFINIYNAVPEGDQDKLISVVGRMIDHIRSAVSTDANPSLRVDAVRAALVQQMTPYEQPSNVPDESRKQIEEDIKWIRSQFVKGGAK